MNGGEADVALCHLEFCNSHRHSPGDIFQHMQCYCLNEYDTYLNVMHSREEKDYKLAVKDKTAAKCVFMQLQLLSEVNFIPFPLTDLCSIYFPQLKLYKLS